MNCLVWYLVGIFTALISIDVLLSYYLVKTVNLNPETEVAAYYAELYRRHWWLRLFKLTEYIGPTTWDAKI